MMTKTEAVQLFGESQAALGRAVRLSRARISQWPEQLEQAQIDRVLGAAVRLGVALPLKYQRLTKSQLKRLAAQTADA